MEFVPRDLLDDAERSRKYAETLLGKSTMSPRQRDERRAALGLMPTPREMVYEENSLHLIRFRTTAGNLGSGTPIVIVPSLILRWHILDLMKGHSLIEALVEQGHDVWLVDWGVPGPEHGSFSYADYVGTFLRRCVRQVTRRTGHQSVHLIGQCLGGVLAAMYAAAFPQHVKRLVTLTTPVDFENAGLLSLWTRKETFPLDAILAGFGPIIPAEFVHAWFRLLDVKATVESYKRLYDNVLNEAFMHSYAALDDWLEDKIPMSAVAFANLIGDLYQENRLVKGEMTVHGRPVDLSRITCPVLNISAEFDHVFPESSVLALNEKVSGPVTYHRATTGHVTCVTLFPQRLDTFARINTFLA